MLQQHRSYSSSSDPKFDTANYAQPLVTGQEGHNSDRDRRRQRHCRPEAAPAVTTSLSATVTSFTAAVRAERPRGAGKQQQQQQQQQQKEKRKRGGCSSSVLAFTLLSGLAMCAQASLAMYNKSVVTSVEKEFGISSREAGVLAGSFNIGNLLFIFPVRGAASARRGFPH